MINVGPRAQRNFRYTRTYLRSTICTIVSSNAGDYRMSGFLPVFPAPTTDQASSRLPSRGSAWGQGRPTMKSLDHMHWGVETCPTGSWTPYPFGKSRDTCGTGGARVLEQHEGHAWLRPRPNSVGERPWDALGWRLLPGPPQRGLELCLLILPTLAFALQSLFESSISVRRSPALPSCFSAVAPISIGAPF